MRILVVKHDSKQRVSKQRVSKQRVRAMFGKGFDLLMVEGLGLNVIYPRTKETGDEVKKIDPNSICPSTDYDYAEDKDYGYGHFVTTTPIERIIVKLVGAVNACEPCEHGHVVTTS